MISVVANLSAYQYILSKRLGFDLPQSMGYSILVTGGYHGSQIRFHLSDIWNSGAPISVNTNPSAGMVAMISSSILSVFGKIFIVRQLG